MRALLRNPRVLYGLFVFFVVVAFGAAWLPEGPSIREIYVPLSKAADFERGCLSVHGPVWWTPNYLQGQSWAGIWSTPLSLALLELGRLAFHPFGLGPLAAYKIVALLSLAAAGAAMYAFGLELTGSAWTAAAAGIFYLLCPEVSLRLGQAEHLAFGGAGLCFAFPPLVCRALLRLQRMARERDFHARRLALALPFGAFFLMATKMAVLSLPLFAAYGLWLLFDLAEPADRGRFLGAALAGGLWGGLLGCLPLLPLLREEQWMTLFSTDPLQTWQVAFALKSAACWWDRGSTLIGQVPDVARFAGRAFYIGIPWSLALGGAVLEIGPWRGWLSTPGGRLCRLFLCLALLFASLSCGLCSPWLGHRQLLDYAASSSDWAAPLLWIALGVQGALVYRLASFWSPNRFVPPVAALLYLFGSSFAALQYLPPFDQIRAPAVFWTLNGSFCVAVAGALALRGAVERRVLFPNMRAVRTAARGLVLAAVALVAWFDFAPYHAEFAKNGLDPASTYPDYLQAAAFLRNQPWGYIQEISGRYFDLTLPQLTGKPLTCEAALSYFQPRWIRPYQNLARADAGAFKTFLRASGVRYIFMDRHDPVFDPKLDGYLRKRYPLLFENAGFSIYGFPPGVAPALATGRVIAAPPQGAPGPVLEALDRDLWPIEAGAAPAPIPGPRDATSQVVPLAGPRNADYQAIAVPATPPGQPWVILPESYHPDWQAESDGQRVPVYRAAGCLLAARAAHDGAGVTFHFRPPWWYNGCLLLDLLAWIVSFWLWRRRV